MLNLMRILSLFLTILIKKAENNVINNKKY